MKNWCLFLVILFFIGCSDDEKEQEYRQITIVHHYPYLFEKHSIDDDINRDTLELFTQKIYLINSITQLNENPLFRYCPDLLREELSTCDFNKYTLVIASSLVLSEIVKLECNFRYHINYFEYEYYQSYYSKPLEEPTQYISYIINAFSVKKIPSESKIVFYENSLGSA